VRYDIVSEKKKMTRYGRKDVDNVISVLAEELGVSLMLGANSPGDRYGTRYRLHLKGEGEHGWGKQIFAECGAKLTTERLWTAIDMLRLYKAQQAAAAQAVATLPDIEA